MFIAHAHAAVSSTSSSAGICITNISYIEYYCTKAFIGKQMGEVKVYYLWISCFLYVEPSVFSTWLHDYNSMFDLITPFEKLCSTFVDHISIEIVLTLISFSLVILESQGT